MSTITKSTEQQTCDQQKPNQLLSDLINADKNKLYVENNKRALICFEEFIKLQTNKNDNNNKLSMHLLNLNGFSNLEKYKKNPILILKSYGKNFVDEKKRKFKSQTLGVDEGLINLPKNDFDMNFFDNLKDNDANKLLFSNLDLKNVKDMNNYETLNKALFKTISYIPSKRNNSAILTINSISNKKRKIMKMTDLERGKEIVTKTRINIKKNKADIQFIKMKKLKEDFEQQLKYNFELKKLNNWDVSNIPRNKNTYLSQSFSKKRIMNFNNLNEEESSNMGWLLNIRNDKEKLKVVGRIKQLNEFFNGFGKEQDAIFMQAMKINRKGFVFDAFFKTKEELNDIRVDENEIISGVNFYREVMKTKIKREEMFKSEVSECAEKLWKEKLEKQKNIIASYDLMNNLDELKKKESELFNELTLNTKNQIHVSKMKEKERIKNEKKMHNEEKSKKNNNNVLLHRDNRESWDNKERKESSSSTNAIDRKLSKRNIMLKIQMNNEVILKKLSDLKKEKMLVEEKLKHNNVLLNDIQIRLKRAKVNYTEKVQMLSDYYYQILKKGIDVRKSGLSWVVVKLMELSSFIDKNHFPSFLNDSEINYLMRIGVKSFELNELVKLFHVLKKRQKQLRERHIREDKEKENQIKEEQFNKLKEANKGNKYNIGNDYVEYMEEIQRKYEHVINACLNEKTEENDINQICEKFKKQILSMHNEDIGNIQINKLYELYFIPGSLAQYFSKDKIFRQYFDDIYYLNDEINKRRKELREEKEKEYKKYRNLSNTNYFVKIKQGGEISKSHRVSEQDKIMAALFGNDISV